jgi:hypothetical protein
MIRTVQPELLDALPADAPEAAGARRDLRRLNRLMGHARIVRRQLLRTTGPVPRRVAELGAGDGSFSLRLAERWAPDWSTGRLLLVDRRPAVSAETVRRLARMGWETDVIEADVFDWLSGSGGTPADLMISNLFLHHFDPAELRRLLRLVAGCTERFIACEPRRTSFALAAARLVGWIGCNGITRHDAPVSVRAGFHGPELTTLWPQDGTWELDERPAGLFSHAFSAARRRPRGD